MNYLDNPIWSALSTTHAHYAMGDARAKRYPREITTMGAFASLSPVTPQAWESLAAAMLPRETLAVLFQTEPTAPEGFEIVARVEIVQMVREGRGADDIQRPEKVERLGAAQSEEIVELAKLTNPGPIGARSHEIGEFLGVRNEAGQLIAMAGERFRFPGFAEISGVCTRPGFEGRGLAAQLVQQVMERVTARGDVPFLHSRAENVRAVRLYERLGFVLSRSFPMGVVRKTVSSS
jgi:ribosomal protein S18 acetylase RimI-like enzyme